MLINKYLLGKTILFSLLMIIILEKDIPPFLFPLNRI